MAATQLSAGCVNSSSHSVRSGRLACTAHFEFSSRRLVVSARRLVRGEEPQPSLSVTVAGLSDGLMRTVEGTIVDAGPLRRELEINIDEPGAESPTQRIDLRVASIESVTNTEDTQVPVDGGVRLTVHWPQVFEGQAIPQTFRCGERVRAEIQLLTPQEYRDPGAWSRTEYLLDQGITSTASVKVERIKSLGQDGNRSLACRMTEWQRTMSGRLLGLPIAMQGLPRALRLSEDDAVMLTAMATGDRTYLTHSLRVGFERTGSFHMLVVSGLHLAILAGCLFWCALRLRIPSVPATLLTLVATFVYAVFTGFATPVQRSLWMITLYLIGRLVYREKSVLNTIGFASLCLLTVSPRSLFDSSLQMTLLAVLSIGGIAVPLMEKTIHPYLAATRDLRLTAIDSKLTPQLAQFRVVLRMFAAALQKALSKSVAWKIFPSGVRLILQIVELVFVSCVVELAMTLPMALYFHRITIFALPVNILILPMLVVLMPAALLTLSATIVWPTAAFVPAMVVAALLHVGVALVGVRLYFGLAGRGCRRAN